MSETKSKRWSTSAGPIQTKRVQRALDCIQAEGRTHTEKSGVIGVAEHEMSFMSVFGGLREDATKAWTDLGERFAWTITRDNLQQIIDAAVETVEALKLARPVKDERRTPEQEAQRMAELKRITDERDAKDREKQAACDALLPQLRALYPWAIAPGRLSDHARAGANCKTELMNAFPGIVFSVKTDYNSIRVHWAMGPTVQEVDALLAKYRNGHFDGMTDSHEYDHSAEGEAYGVVLGRVTYVQSSREFESAQYTHVGQLLCAVRGLPWTGLEAKFGEDTKALSDYAFRLLHGTSFPAGAQIVGVRDLSADRSKFCDEMLNIYGEGWAMSERRATLAPEHLAALAAWEKMDEPKEGQPEFLLVLKVPDRSSLPAAVSAEGNRVSYNAEHNGVEIAFAAKPDDNHMRKMKMHGFRCTRRPPWRWYHKFTDANWTVAHELAGVILAPLPKQDPGPDRFDQQVEDNMAAACGL